MEFSEIIYVDEYSVDVYDTAGCGCGCGSGDGGGAGGRVCSVANLQYC